MQRRRPKREGEIEMGRRGRERRGEGTEWTSSRMQKRKRRSRDEEIRGGIG